MPDADASSRRGPVATSRIVLPAGTTSVSLLSMTRERSTLCLLPPSNSAPDQMARSPPFVQRLAGPAAMGSISKLFLVWTAAGSWNFLAKCVGDEHRKYVPAREVLECATRA